MQDKSQAEVNKVISDFQKATNESGDLLHPHFNDKEVQEELSILISRGRTLEEAYAASPRVKTLELESSNQEPPEDKAVAARKEVAKAKRASLRVSPKKNV